MEILTFGFVGMVLLMVVVPRLTFRPEGCVKVLASFSKYSRMVQPEASWRMPWERTQTT